MVRFLLLIDWLWQAYKKALKGKKCTDMSKDLLPLICSQSDRYFLGLDIFRNNITEARNILICNQIYRKRFGKVIRMWCYLHIQFQTTLFVWVSLWCLLNHSVIYISSLSSFPCTTFLRLDLYAVLVWTWRNSFFAHVC